jgi:SAM-dependent methyltransferase
VPCKERRNEFRGVVPLHLTRNQISYIPQARQQGEIALDLGCGDGIHSSVLRELGYVYYGVDFANTAADDLVDAHSLPYHDNLFDLVFSIAVLEHLTQPLKALDEIHRVLKPSKYFIGTVAFLEPFHDNSFFHFSHLGLWAALQSTGFSVEVILCIKGWHVFRAQLEMGFGSHMPRLITSLFAQPFAWALKSYAFLGRRLARNKFRHKRDLSLARHAGGFFFVAQKLPRLTDPIKKSSDINANTGRK